MTSSQVWREIRRRMTPDERRRLVVATAAELFDDAGYTHVTMGDIAKSVGIAKPTLYHYFTSKDEILLAVHEEFIDLLISRHGARQRRGAPPEVLLLEVMADVLELMQTHRGHVRVFFEHHRELPEAARAALRDRRDQYERSVQELFVVAQQAGVFTELDPRLATLATFGMCNWAYQWYRAGGRYTPREVAEQFWRILLGGVAVPASLPALLDGLPPAAPAP